MARKFFNMNGGKLVRWYIVIPLSPSVLCLMESVVLHILSGDISFVSCAIPYQSRE